MTEDARLTKDTIPALYTLSRDGALFSWAYEHGAVEASDRRKRRRIGHVRAAISTTAADTIEERGNGRGGTVDRDDNEEEDQGSRMTSFSGILYPAVTAFSCSCLSSLTSFMLC